MRSARWLSPRCVSAQGLSQRKQYLVLCSAYSGRESDRRDNPSVAVFAVDPFHPREIRHFSLSKILSQPRREPPAWRRLAEQLKDEGCDSLYLDRIHKSFDVQSHVEKLEEEIAEEMARALANTSAKTNYQFARLDFLAGKARSAPPKDLQAAIDEYNAQRDLCIKARHDLIIHRQALGFKTNNHRAVEKHFPLPPKWDGSTT